MKWYIKVLSNYANFQGRARRKEYWMFFLFNLIFAYTALFLGYYLFRNQWFYILYCFAVLIPGVAVAVRRMHDIGKSGWYLLIPIYNLVLCCTAGEQGDNGWGSDPKSNGPLFEFENEPVNPNTN